MIEACGLSHSVLLAPHKVLSCLNKRQKSSEDAEIVREGKEMEDRPFRVERQKARMESTLKAVYHKGQGMRVKQCGMFPLMPVCSSKQPNECQQKLLFYFLTANFLEFLIPVSL